MAAAKTWYERTQIIQKIEMQKTADLRVRRSDLKDTASLCKKTLPNSMRAVYLARMAQRDGEDISEDDIDTVARFAHLYWFVQHPDEYASYLENAQSHISKKLKADMEVFQLALKVGDLPLMEYVCPECYGGV